MQGEGNAAQRAAAAMDVQLESGCEPPLCESQPPGRINKAAFKLLSRRKPCSAVPAIFPVRSKVEAIKPSGKAPLLVRSKTHDVLGEGASVLEGGGASDGRKEELQVQPAHGAVTKSLSFFSLLRRHGRRPEATCDAHFPKQRRSLKGLFGSLRWSRRDKVTCRESREKEVQEGPQGADEEAVVEQQAVVLSLEPQPSAAAEPSEDIPPSEEGDSGSLRESPRDTVEEANGSLLDSQEASPSAGAVPYVSAEFSPSRTPEPTTKRKYSSPEADQLTSTGPIMTITPAEHSVTDPPVEPSMDRLCSMFTDVTSLKSFDSLTGCGDIIADAEEEGAGSGSGTSSGTSSSSSGGGSGAGVDGGQVAGEAGAPTGGSVSAAQVCTPASVPSPSPVPAPMTPPIPNILRGHMDAPRVQGSGVVAYMGGGEEMASPDEVDDADMQDLWHMLPQGGEDTHSGPRGPHPENKPQVRTLGLSKMPVSDKAEEKRSEEAVQEALPNSDEGYWDSPTPGPEEEEEEGKCGPSLRDTLPRDSCSGDALYDLYVDSDQSPGPAVSDDDVSSLSTRSSKRSAPGKATSAAASFRSMKGSTSLPRDSRIPISIKQIPPSHSASQGALLSATHVTSSAPHSLPSKTELPRTKIPVSKVPVRRISNKPASARIHDLHRK
ncbi:APC membrane recruitment protein 2 [Arapaima gigas]